MRRKKPARPPWPCAALAAAAAGAPADEGASSSEPGTSAAAVWEARLSMRARPCGVTGTRRRSRVPLVIGRALASTADADADAAAGCAAVASLPAAGAAAPPAPAPPNTAGLPAPVDAGPPPGTRGVLPAPALRTDAPRLRPTSRADSRLSAVAGPGRGACRSTTFNPDAPTPAALPPAA